MSTNAHWTRRELLIGVAAMGGASCVRGSKEADLSAHQSARLKSDPSGKQPTLFVAHGAPPLLDDAGWVGELSAWGTSIGKPRSILVVSAHWEGRPVTLGATRTVPLVYDFYGFPERYYQQKYPAPGAPELAARVRSLVPDVAEDPTRGLDHGAYVPLVAMYPGADVPVLQVSMPTLEPHELLQLGRALAPLRDEGVLIVGSGFLIHNMRAAMQAMRTGASDMQSWALEFDTWVTEALARKDVDALLQYREKAPGVHMALPTHEHFAPLFVALGAALDAPAPRFPINGFFMGVGTRRSIQFG